MNKKPNRNSSARAEADSDKMPIVIPSASIAANPMLCVRQIVSNHIKLYKKRKQLKKEGFTFGWFVVENGICVFKESSRGLYVWNKLSGESYYIKTGVLFPDSLFYIRYNVLPRWLNRAWPKRNNI